MLNKRVALKTILSYTNHKEDTMKTNQKGFSVVEILIIIVVVGLLGTLGWLVYDSIKSKTSSTQTGTPQKEEAPKQEASVPKEKFLEVKEWSVKIPLNDQISDLSYEVTGMGLNLHDKNQAVIKFYTARLKKANGICSENYFPVTLNRGIASDIPIMGDGPGPDDTITNSYGYFYDHNEIKPDGGRINVGLIKVGTYYYTDALYPGAACSNYKDEAAEKARNEEPKDAIVEAVRAMQPL